MKFKKWLTLLLAGLMALSVFGFSSCDLGSGDSGDTTGGQNQDQNDQNDDNKDKDDTDDKGDTGDDDDPTPPQSTDTWRDQSIWLNANPLVPTEPAEMPTADDAKYRSLDVAVHDPSIFRDPNAKGNKYYAFGSHFMVASSTDLIEWTQEVGDGSSEASGQRVAQSLYGEGVDWRTVLKESVAYAGRNMPSTWAPDVEYYNGKYYMYVSLTSAFGSNKSVISRVESDKVLGPYSNETVLIKTGETGGPNAIDPELFYDKDGKLWMVYGSHFAGVYIKELYNEGDNWGLPKEDGYGKLLWKGGSKVVEGPFVFYNATTEYYYLMTTYGDLNTDYNMRFARSKNPDGPYVDVTGTDLATSSNNGVAHGNAVAGNYKFSSDNGYAAMGHNSVIKDKQGRYFVIYHARRQDGATGVTAPHHLFVSQLYFNEEGWPVMSPNAYVGEKAGTFTEAQVQGEYEIVVHSAETTVNFVSSEKYTLAADGKVMSGTTEKGSWTLKQGFYVEVTLNNVVYKGVAVPTWDMYSKKQAAVSLTAVSDQGVSLWAVHS